MVLLSPISNALASEPVYDFRVVIDISGSMKQTDPENLRVPALKLLNGLIPSNSYAGVWTFGRYVDMTVKWGLVNDQWRKQADLGADKINSRALFTNIESALARASAGWDKPDSKRKRVLLMLTDGQVDISKDIKKNQASRQKILSKSLSALRRAGVEVHSVALSEASDVVLLKQLALETGGSFALAQTAIELQKVFFKVFERANKPETILLRGRQFMVDSSINEMTLLLFRAANSSPTFLIPPDSPAMNKDKPRGARWRSDQGYDMVTVKNPQPGSWRIDAELDPDSRLMVLTDLSLKVDGIPAYSDPVTALQIGAVLFSKGEKISKNSFLRFVDFTVTHIDPSGEETEVPMQHSTERSEKGRYSLPLEKRLSEGSHEFVISANSRTFSRSRRVNLQVQWPVEVTIEPSDVAGVYQFKLRAREEILKPDGMVAEVEVTAPSGDAEPLELEFANGWWQAMVETTEDGLYQAKVKISGQTQTDQFIDLDLGAFSMLGVNRPEPVSLAMAETKDPIEPAEDSASVEDQPIDWRLAGIVIIAINGSLFLFGIIAWLVIRKRRKAPADTWLLDDVTLSDELSDDETLSDKASKDEELSGEVSDDEALGDEASGEEASADQALDVEALSEELSDDEALSDQVLDVEELSAKAPGEEALADEALDVKTLKDEASSEEVVVNEALDVEALSGEVSNDKTLKDEASSEEVVVNEALDVEALSGEVSDDETLKDEESSGEAMADEALDVKTLNDGVSDDETLKDEASGEEALADEALDVEVSDDASLAEDASSDETSSNEASDDKELSV